MSEKHFVTFLSPGTFVSETTTHEVDSWNVAAAVAMSKDIKERHGATPYGFYFETKTSDGWEPKTVRTSGTYYLGGMILTLEDIPDTPENRILRSNMKYNHIDMVIENTNSWKITLPFYPDKDVLLA
jgi:hypothetical protein